MTKGWFRLTHMGRPIKKQSDFDARLGSVVRSKRAKAELTRDELAARTGIAEANIKRREAGANVITVSELERLAVALGESSAEMVEEALYDYGGIRKLLAEHTPVSQGVISLNEHRKNREPLTEESARGQAHAAIFDPEHESDVEN